MIRPSLLLARSGDPLAFDTAGEPAEAPSAAGAAVLVAAPVTDALKAVSDGLITGSIDRRTVAAVVSFSVSREILERLSGRTFSASEFVEAVVALGVEWAMAVQEEPLRPFSAQ